MHPQVARQLRRTGKLEADRDVWILPAGEALGASTEQAVAQGIAWLGRA